MLTVRNLISDLDVRLHTGDASLDLPVRWVHISELLDPTPWLSGGEVLLTTGMQLDTPERQREFATRLADHQLAGLGFGTGFKHDAAGAVVVSHLTMSTLDEIARGTGGRAFRWSPSDPGLSGLAAAIEGMEQKSLAREWSYRRKERFQLPLAIGPDGFVRATGDFSEPIGPAWWNRR